MYALRLLSVLLIYLYIPTQLIGSVYAICNQAYGILE